VAGKTGQRKEGQKNWKNIAKLEATTAKRKHGKKYEVEKNLVSKLPSRNLFYR
jgi:hypothetical protein